MSTPCRLRILLLFCCMPLVKCLLSDHRRLATILKPNLFSFYQNSLLLISCRQHKRAAVHLQHQQQRLLLAATAKDMAHFEVEEKFALTDLDSNVLESRLRKLGFEPPKKSYTMVDWYFDDNKLSLSTQDLWFRYREKLMQGQSDSGSDFGTWELKLGRKSSDSEAATVYEEIVGEEAICKVLSFLEPVDKVSEQLGSEHDGFSIPKIPTKEPHGLFPFARIETCRSSWKPNSDQAGDKKLVSSVDLDTTNFGYAVGEVEIVVDKIEDIPSARQQVKSLIAELTNSASNGNETQPEDKFPAIGKLEYFLLKNRPFHYEACIKSGTMRNQSKPQEYDN